MLQNTQTTNEHPHFNQQYRQALAAGIPQITPTELSIGVLLALNHDTKQIATKLRMDVRSIDNHRYHIRKKLGLSRKDNLETYLLQIVHNTQRELLMK